MKVKKGKRQKVENEITTILSAPNSHPFPSLYSHFRTNEHSPTRVV